jgi:hypothetical protein
MASIYELMAGNLGDESSYLADEPLFASAKNLSQLDTGPSAWGNRKVSGFEQFALPFVKGLLTNYMLKQAKENAQDEYYKDTKQSPILRQLEASLQPKGVGPVADGNQYAAILEDNTKAPQGSPLAEALLGKFSSEERPDGFTAKAMKTEMLGALLEKSQEEEKAKIREALAAEMEKMRLETELKRSPEALTFIEKEAKAKKAGELAAEGPAGSKKQTDLDSLRKEFTGSPEYKEFSAVKSSADALKEALKDKSAVSDQELVRRSIQMIEPGMAVREGEQKAVALSQSIPDAWRGELNKALKSGTALSDEVRDGIKRLAGRAYTAQRSRYEDTRGFYEGLAEERGYERRKVSPLGAAPSWEEFTGGGADKRGASEEQLSPQEFIAQLKRSGASKEEAKRLFEERYGR